MSFKLLFATGIKCLEHTLILEHFRERGNVYVKCLAKVNPAANWDSLVRIFVHVGLSNGKGIRIRLV